MLANPRLKFPPSAIKDTSLLEHSDLSTFCSWQGYASYWSIKVDGIVPYPTLPYLTLPYSAINQSTNHSHINK
jgi:uncharacterized protein (DUF427 family)